jgi:Ca2+-binding EF-hand superfamily protein
VFYWTLLARHLSQYFDAYPEMKPKQKSDGSSHQQKITLSQQQENQIKEIFDLFDTDGGGTIDRQELKVAMTALGFQDAGKQGKQKMAASQKMLETIDSDQSNSVSLDEFQALMKGELTMSDPMGEVKAVFMALSCIEGNGNSDIITLNKLRAATQKFNVRLTEEELQIMMSEANTKGDQYNQTIDEDDFMRLMRLSPWF